MTLDNRKGRKRDLLPDQQIPVMDFCLEAASEAEAAYEQLLTGLESAVKSGAMQAGVGAELYARVFTLYRRNDHMHDVIGMLRENAVDVPLVEVERIQALRRKLNRTTKP